MQRKISHWFTDSSEIKRQQRPQWRSHTHTSDMKHIHGTIVQNRWVFLGFFLLLISCLYIHSYQQIRQKELVSGPKMEGQRSVLTWTRRRWQQEMKPEILVSLLTAAWISTTIQSSLPHQLITTWQIQPEFFFVWRGQGKRIHVHLLWVDWTTVMGSLLSWTMSLFTLFLSFPFLWCLLCFECL